MQKEGINMNQSHRITDKTMHVILLVGSCILAVAILALSVAVSINRRRDQSTVQTSAPAATTVDAPAANVRPVRPTIDEMTFILPVEGGLLQVHDLQVLTYSTTMRDYRIHTGIDVETEAGAAVYACASGVVAEVGVDALMGNTIVLDHGNGVQSIYRNLGDTLPEGLVVGASVKAGQLIGAVGESAIVEVGELPHLHFELTNGGEQVDPVTYLDYAPVSKQLEDQVS